MDEAPVWYEMLYKNVIDQIGNKHVSVKSFNCDKVRISLLLTILRIGNKLAPLVVFRGKTDGPMEKELKKNHMQRTTVFLLNAKKALG